MTSTGSHWPDDHERLVRLEQTVARLVSDVATRNNSTPPRNNSTPPDTAAFLRRVGRTLNSLAESIERKQQ